MEKIRIKEAIVVEGRYDQNTLAQVVDTLILQTEGFGIFSKPEQMSLLRQVAKERGLLVLTDGDGAGFVIRNRIISSIPKEHLKHSYIPDVYGKERRKVQHSKEGKLGVEGMSPEVLRQVLLRGGATLLSEDSFSEEEHQEPPIDNQDFFRWGLTGEGSALRREALLKAMALPEHMSKKALLQLFASCYRREEVEEHLRALNHTKGE